MRKFSVQIIPHDSDDTFVIKPNGAIDDRSCRIIQEHFNAAIENKQYRIVVDLSDTPIIGSSGLGLFLGTSTILRTHGGDLILMSVPKTIADIFSSLNIADHFQRIENLSELEVSSSS